MILDIARADEHHLVSVRVVFRVSPLVAIRPRPFDYAEVVRDVNLVAAQVFSEHGPVFGDGIRHTFSAADDV